MERTVAVELGPRSYDVRIGSGVLVAGVRDHSEADGIRIEALGGC